MSRWNPAGNQKWWAIYPLYQGHVYANAHEFFMWSMRPYARASSYRHGWANSLPNAKAACRRAARQEGLTQPKEGKP